MIQVTSLWRHPIKSLGREALKRVTLTAGQSMPYDRLWAIAHDSAKANGSEWAACQNFNRGAQSPSMMAVTATLEETSETITLRHPARPDLTVQPDTESGTLLAWASELVDADRAQPSQLFRLEGRSFTDTPFASVSLCNSASHDAVEGLAQSPLQQERWRGNIWLNGAAPWSEFDWLGRDLRIGSVILNVEERIRRCKATTANTDTGVRDVDTLKALNTLGHQDFGIYATVKETGTIALGDQLELV